MKNLKENLNLGKFSNEKFKKKNLNLRKIFK
jgi:hypothetical protein